MISIDLKQGESVVDHPPASLNLYIIF